MTTDLDRARVAELIGEVARRDRGAFAELYDRTSAKLFGVLLRMLQDRAEAEDALQEVFIKVWRGAPRFAAGKASPMSWLIAIARNHAVDRLRARNAALARDEREEAAEQVPHRGPTPEDLSVGRSESARIAECLARLDAARAKAVKGAYLDGLSYKELAAAFEVPLNTMRTWLRRSLISLRECMAE
ncbi:sigma-70 family RNA polymerase sigma factor [Rhodovulum sp. DZ06]|uniref:sigma-70 family RNA polymerase sigma factor n=1 Tax=Rhodovulum sp. DZ06 TaxID=3425126 RepID=UPI003D330AB5